MAEKRLEKGLRDVVRPLGKESVDEEAGFFVGGDVGRTDFEYVVLEGRGRGER